MIFDDIGAKEVIIIIVIISQAVHGEQYMELLGPLPTSATLTCRGEVVDILDKGSGAVILADGELYGVCRLFFLKMLCEAAC